MSAFGKRWLIDGVGAGPISRSYAANGEYTVIFEREYASLEQIEGINWAQPTIEHVWPHGNETGLPEGYGFDVKKIDYDSGGKFYRVTLQTGKQYLGDVTGYQEQIEEQAATIEEQAATIQELQEAGTAAELEAGLDAAYEEGVNSIE